MMKQKILRRTLAGALTAATLWAVAASAGSESFTAAWDAMRARQPLALLRWGIGDWFGTDGLPLETLVALGQSPLLLAGRRQVADLLDEPVTDGTEPAPEPDVPPPLPPLTVETGDLAFLDNGVPAQTASAASGNYAMVGSVPIKNASRQTLDTAALADGSFSAALSEQAPQVLIVHTHGSEAYSMPRRARSARTTRRAASCAWATRSRRCSRRTASPSSTTGRCTTARATTARMRAVSPRSRGIWRSIRR